MPRAPRAEQDTLEAHPRRDTAQPVNLTDRIDWQWYAVAAALPLVGALVGFVAGIVFMARSKIGPALALWATSWLALVVWGVVGWAIILSQAFDEIANEAEVSTSQSVQPAPSPEEDQPAPSSQDDDPAPSPADPRTGADTEVRCGNLMVTRDSVTCGFAQNVFYEYWTATDGGSSPTGRISAYSPALGRELKLSCDEGASVSCFTEAGGEVRIPVAALDEYTQADADAYAASNTVRK